MRKHRRVLVWMRRALRVKDHQPLWNALQDADEVIPVVCLRNESRYNASTPRREFIRGALVDLDSSLREAGSYLAVRIGDPRDGIPAAAAAIGADAVYAVKVYDPATRRRDERISRALRSAGKEFHTFKDCVLFEEKEVVAKEGTPYRVFTPYKRAWLERSGDAPRPLGRLRSIPTPRLRDGFIRLSALPGFSGMSAGGGEREGRRRLQRFIARALDTYGLHRDLPAIDGTSRLSPHLANGTLSIRTLYWKVRERRDQAGEAGRRNIDTFTSELIWREFYYAILANYPRVATGSFSEEFDGLAWSTNARHLSAWQEGRTGYPIVDAGMRQLNTEGWMHNRVRMIVGSFLTKDLHISWQEGERYFSEHLADLDIASNNGGWQWVAGTGTDASPWFRVFNPVTQAEKFDPVGKYVRSYLPELARVPASLVHRPWEMSAVDQRAYRCVIGKDYPAPLVDHARERLVTLDLYHNPGASLQRSTP